MLTAHDVLPREPRPGQLEAQRRLYERFDAIVVHSEHGRARLTSELGVDPARVHVIPHGVFEHLARRAARRRAAATDRPAGRPVLRPDAPLQGDRPAARGVARGRGRRAVDRGDAAHGHRAAARAPRRRTCASSPASSPTASCRRTSARADLVVLPYREIDQSGVLFTALAFGKPLLLSDVGGFPEIAATGAARTFPAGDAAALQRGTQRAAWPIPERSSRWLAERARAVRAGTYSWQAVAARTLELYESLLRRESAPMRTALEIVFWLSAALIVWTQVGLRARARDARPGAAGTGTARTGGGATAARRSPLPLADRRRPRRGARDRREGPERARARLSARATRGDRRLRRMRRSDG